MRESFENESLVVQANVLVKPNITILNDELLDVYFMLNGGIPFSTAPYCSSCNNAFSLSPPPFSPLFILTDTIFNVEMYLVGATRTRNVEITLSGNRIYSFDYPSSMINFDLLPSFFPNKGRYLLLVKVDGEIQIRRLYVLSFFLLFLPSLFLVGMMYFLKHPPHLLKNFISLIFL